MAKKVKKTTKKKVKKKTGRPSKFVEDMVRQVKILAIKGFTDKEIAKLYAVTEQTVNNWKTQYPDFFESLKNGKEIADNVVERALFERATGYTHPEVHISNHQGVVTKTDIIKHYAPDPTSAIFWLKNRKPGEWREKHETDVNLNIMNLADIAALMSK